MRRQLAVTAAALAGLVLCLAGCGASSNANSSAPGSSATPVGRDSAKAKARDPLLKSHMLVLTKLSQAQLCDIISQAQVRKILGSASDKPLYGAQSGLGNTCLWIMRGGTQAASDELYVGISSIIDWSGAQQVDKLVTTSKVEVDGHPALAVAPQAKINWGQVDVALGGTDDPVAEFRAPTLTGALAMAKAAIPHILSYG
jgi:hypothetical protein